MMPNNPNGGPPPIPQSYDNTLATNIEPGGFWLRAVAAFIDGLAIQILIWPLSLVQQAIAPVPKIDPQHPMSAFGAAAMLVSILVYFAMCFVYYGWFYKNKGASPGKLLLGMRVLMADTGSHCSYKTTFLREVIGKALSASILMIGFLMVGFRRDKRGLHDLIAGTQVIRVKS